MDKMKRIMPVAENGSEQKDVTRIRMCEGHEMTLHVIGGQYMSWFDCGPSSMMGMVGPCCGMCRQGGELNHKDSYKDWNQQKPEKRAGKAASGRRDFAHNHLFLSARSLDSVTGPFHTVRA